MFEFTRSDENPILIPSSKNDWEAQAAFNGCPVLDRKKIHFLFRASSSTMSSSIGYSYSTDGVHFKPHKKFIAPEYDWERFGCEDPRVTKMNGKYYIFYTALSTFPFTPDGIKIAVAITKDFKKIEEKHLVTPFNAKAMALFPYKINGKFVAILSVNTDKPPAKICIAIFDNEEQIWSREYWEEWYASLDHHTISLQRSSDDHVEVGAVPVKTKNGWLLIYSHINNYFSPPAKFGIEAVLLDLKKPRRIIARTEEPILDVREEYEKYGIVPNIVFPSGALVKNGKIHLYYGATDTVCALASGNLKDLIKELLKSPIQRLERNPKNPILEPIESNSWENRSAFNPGAIYLGGKVHLLYRAMGNDNISVCGYASSVDGFKIDERLPEPVYVPRENFEKKMVAGGGAGCEDVRLTKIDNTIYMCYTAYNGKDFPRVAMSTIKADDFVNKKWNWTKPILISPPKVDDKDAAFFPKKINGKYAILHRLGVSIWIDFVKDLNFGDDKWLKGKILMSPRIEQKDSKKIGIAGPPIETPYGWLLIYHGISKKSDNHYHLRAALLDLADPTKVIIRTRNTIFEPETVYERYGDVRNVVFSNGIIVKDGTLFIYYGGADKVTGVATINLNDLLKRMLSEIKLNKIHNRS
jgi:predicted GH43/DUF377 family glycosyl hydrolase